ncbi:protein kinase [Actinomadura barringtoniae]|uniref:non-specific serine/threonine protein kinase n=1 Tax=Actinomadura barringtoniae TaxID=1427535 RepID=A0A939PJY6_9ACTN|nr:serine/threonine-protein kinase [Actinomadura barringtoniae]MBO2453740.1 protein kinase [Actinomadura barringtoniae]
MTEDVPGYRVLEQVGEGGFSVVYRAHQERLDRAVALKILHINAVDEATLRRFERECKITGRLSGHPNIVTVLDTGKTRSGAPYIAMEYFERGTLIDRLEREGPLPVAEVLRIGVKMAGALAATHETDVLHRDVKPQNILVSRYGEPALADFGIARLTDSFDHSHTQAFTPHHAAPEVLQGTTPGVGSDIYSLGSTLYQLLAGLPAFKGPKGEGIAPLMLRIMNDAPPPIQRADVPQPVFEVITRAMAKAPEHRFASAVDFAQRMQQIQAELGLPITDLATSGIMPQPTPLHFPDHPRPPAVPEWAPTTPRSSAAETVTPETPGASGLSGVVPADALDLSPWHPAAASSTTPPAPSAHVTSPQRDPSFPQSAAQQAQQQAQHAQQGQQAPTWPPGPPSQESTRPPEQHGDGPKRGLIIAAGVALVGGLAAGIGALVLTTGDDGGGNKATPVASTPATGGVPQTGNNNQPGQSLPPISKAQRAAARPFGLTARAIQGGAGLAWKLPPGAKELTIIVQRAPWGQSQIVSAGIGGVTATVAHLNPRLGYCFRVGAVLRINSNGPADVSWSVPFGLRGARCHA